MVLQFAGIIALASLVIPLIQSGIELAEKLFKGSGRGQEKKTTVVTQFGNAWDKAIKSGVLKGEAATVSSIELNPLVSMMIDLMVGIFNSAGVFPPAEAAIDPIIEPAPYNPHGGY